MRITKSKEERKLEIILCAKRLFEEKGYQNTKVIDITKALDVAKGTFYYYFESKEDVIVEIVNLTIDSLVESAKEVANNETMSPIEKIKMLFFSDTLNHHEVESVAKSVDAIRNFELQNAIMVEVTNRLSPILADIITEGVTKGLFHTEHILVKSQFILSGAQFLLDSGYFRWSDEELAEKKKVLPVLFEELFNIPKGEL